MRNIFLSLLLVFSSAGALLAQNCSINAGLSTTLCLSDTVKLFGTRSGIYSPNATCKWTQISGPGNMTINKPDSLVTFGRCYIPGTYTLKLTNKCQDGIISEDTISIIVLPITIADAGRDTIICPFPKYQLEGNIPLGTDEHGEWSIVSNNNGITINSPTNPKSTITLNANVSGITKLRWTISNRNGCISFDDVLITNCGGVMPINAGPDQILSKCYSTTTCTKLTASNGGTGFGNQIGTWTFISGPNVPTIHSPNNPITNVCDLNQGVYTFRYTVNGPCATGYDDVSVVVQPPSQGITKASAGANIFLCNNNSTTTLTGNNPSNSNETVQWTQKSGPVTANIMSPNTPVTIINGLTQPGTYTFQYIIQNLNSGCFTNSTVNIYILQPGTIDAGPDQILACNVTEAIISPTATGCNAINYRVINGPSGNSFPYPSSWFNIATNNKLKGLNKPGTYTVQVMGDACVTVVDYVNITVSRTPTGANAGSNQNFTCSATTTQLAGNNPVLTGLGTGRWSQISGPNNATLVTPENYICDIRGAVPGSYTFRWTISAGNNCPDNYDDITVITPGTTVTTANAGPDRLICPNSPFSLDGNTPRPDETVKWTSSSANIKFLPDNNVAMPLLTGIQPNSIYTLIYTITNSCGLSSSDTVLIRSGSTTGPTSANAGPDRCLPASVNTIQLNGNAPVSGTGKWTQIPGNPVVITNPQIHNTTVTGLIKGTYKFIWTISVDGCFNNTSDTVVITISDNTSVSNAGQDITRCGNSVTLNANTPVAGTGHWSQISGDGSAVISSVINPTTTITNLMTGEYTFRWTIENGTCSSNFDDVRVLISTPPSVAYAGSDQNLCLTGANTVTLKATPPTSGTGQWVLISGPSLTSASITNPTLPTTNVKGLTNGSYIFRWIVSGGPDCPQSTDDVNINISIPANAGADKSLCNSGSTTLSGNIGSTGIWTKISGPNVNIIQTPAGNPIANITGLLAGATYTFRYSIPSFAGCPSSYDDVIVTNGSATLIPDAGNDESYCNATSFQLNGSKPGPGETGKWSIESGPTGATFLPDASNPRAILSSATTGIYILKWTISNGICTISDSKRIDNYQTPSIANAGSDDTICLVNSIELHGNTPSAGIGKWSLISGPNTPIIDAPNNPASNVKGLIPGLYKFAWTISNYACPSSSDEVQIVILNKADTAIAGNDQYICSDSTSLTANMPTGTNKGIWSQIEGPSAAIFSSLSNPECTITHLIPGKYKFCWKIYNERCYSTDTLEVNVNMISKAYAGNDDMLCLAESISLNANMPLHGIGKWNQVSGPNQAIINTPNNPNTTVTGLTAGVYKFSWTITNSNCPPSVDEVQIILLNNADIAYAGRDVSICLNSTMLNANMPTGGNRCEWTQLSGPNTAIISSVLDPKSTVSNLIPGRYKFVWKIYNARCYNTDTVELVVNEGVNLNAGNDFTLCNTIKSIPLSGASISGYTSEGYWSIISGRGTLNTEAPTKFPGDVTFTPDNDYSGPVVLRLTSNDNCRTIYDDITITVTAAATANDAVNDTIRTDPNTPVDIEILKNDKAFKNSKPEICDNGAIDVKPMHGTVMVNYDGTVTYTPNIGFTGIDSFNYKLCNFSMIKNDTNSGCYKNGSDNAWVFISIEGCIIPNSFSPDGDGVNDYFEIPCAQGNMKFSVFNRWGIEVFRNDNYNNDWNGYYNGAPLPDGTYYYMLTYSIDNTKKLDKEGFITLHR